MPANQPTPAKITRPRSRGAYPRTRLFGALNAARSASCVWISGPPGSGKTTLAASYLEHLQPATLWYQVDEGDADISSFFYYLGLAAKKATRKRNTLPLFTPEFTGGLPVFTRRYFEQLCSWLKTPFVLVFDNYQLAPAAAPIHEVMALAVDTLPEGGNILVLSREAPPPAFSRVALNHDLVIIDWDALRLDQAEIAAIAQLQRTDQLTEPMLDYLASESQGWVAGLILLLQSDTAVPSSGTAPPRKTRQAMFDYFAREIFERQDVNTRKFLMKAALLPKMTPQMARQLTGSRQAKEILNDMNRRNYFTEQHAKTEALYQLHPLYRAFLLNQLMHKLSDKELASLRNKAAQLLERNEQPEAANELYQAAGQWIEAARLICERAPEFLAQGRNQTVQRWIEQIPESFRADTPWLSYWLGASRIFFDPRNARAELEIAYRKLKANGELTGAVMAWCSIVDSYVNEWGDYEPLDPWLDDGEELLVTCKKIGSPEVQAQFISSLFIGMTFRRPDHPKLSMLANRARQIVIDNQDQDSILLTVISLMNYYHWLGHHDKIRQLVREISPIISKFNRRSTVATLQTQLIQIFLDTINARPEEGLRTIDGTMELIKTSGAFIYGNLFLGNYALFAMQLQDIKLAHDVIDEFGRSTPKDQTLRCALFHHLAGCVAWSSGQFEEAREHAESALRLADRAGCLFPQAQVRIVVARICISLGNTVEAKAHLKMVRNMSRQMNSALIDYFVLILEAEISLNSYDEQRCIELLRQAFRIGRRHELFVMEETMYLTHMSRFCAIALQNDIEVDYIRKLIRMNKLTPDPTTAVTDHWPWPVRIYALGEFKLLCDDQPVTTSTKSKKRVLELLKALISFGGKDISAVRLEEALWPDAEADTARSNLKSTLHRLRKLLGHP